MSAPKRYTITAALPYTNGPIHIGHLAGVYVPADIYARYLRNIGKDVAYICGSDEHGVAIPMRAKKEGVSPQDIISQNFSKLEPEFLSSSRVEFFCRCSKDIMNNYYRNIYQHNK